jgi:hypothetical protein
VESAGTSPGVEVTAVAALSFICKGTAMEGSLSGSFSLQEKNVAVNRLIKTGINILFIAIKLNVREVKIRRLDCFAFLIKRLKLVVFSSFF